MCGPHWTRRAGHLRPWTLRPSSPAPPTWSAAACGSWRERSGPAARRSPQTRSIRRGVGWPHATCGGPTCSSRHPSGGFKPRGRPRSAGSWPPLPRPDSLSRPVCNWSASTSTVVQRRTLTGRTVKAMRSIGAMRGAVCVLGRPAADRGVNVAEGLDDALALAARLPWPAVSAGGRGSFFDVDLARWLPSLSARYPGFGPSGGRDRNRTAIVGHSCTLARSPLVTDSDRGRGGGGGGGGQPWAGRLGAADPR